MNVLSRLRRSLFTLGVLGVAFFAGRAVAGQSHMQNALNALQNAISEMRQAPPNKGGYKYQAVQFSEQAINEVQAGIAFAQAQGNPP
jgi:hypothetical protein